MVTTNALEAFVVSELREDRRDALPLEFTLIWVRQECTSQLVFDKDNVKRAATTEMGLGDLAGPDVELVRRL